LKEILMAQETWTIHIDGAARGNPGPAACALVISRPGQPDWEESICLGRTTNNIAEYTALVRALERAEQLRGRRLVIFSDSELLVKQMNGEYRVKNADLKELFDQAQELKDNFDRVTIKHVYREQNKRADELCNEALDGDPTSPPEVPTNTEKHSPKDLAKIEALACLKSAGVSDTERVWKELFDILKRHGVIAG
jgi:ribonuclease HI